MYTPQLRRVEKAPVNVSFLFGLSFQSFFLSVLCHGQNSQTDYMHLKWGEMRQTITSIYI